MVHKTGWCVIFHLSHQTAHFLILLFALVSVGAYLLLININRCSSLSFFTQ